MATKRGKKIAQNHFPRKSTNRLPVIEVHQTTTYLTSTLNNTKVQPQTSLTQILFIMQTQCLCLPLKQRPVPIKPFSSGSDYYFLTQKQPNKSTPQTKPSSNLPLQKSQFSFRQDNKQSNKKVLIILYSYASRKIKIFT